MGRITRRSFIKIVGAGAAAAGVVSGLATKWWGLDPDPITDPGSEGETIVPTFCELCFWKCGVLAHVKDGKVTKLTGNPDHPLSRGRLCPRGAGGTGLLYDPDRLKKPLIRVEERGQQVFREATWDEALDKVAEGMLAIREKYGPEAFALFQHGYGGSWFKHLTKAYGSANITAPSYAQCRGPREAGFLTTFGVGCGSPENLDIENARCITLIGSHLGENMHNTQVQEFADAIGNGAGIVVVDPRFSIAASKANFYLPIKPGTDMALLLAWMNVILQEGLYDAPYLAKHAVGLEELKKHVADKTPEWAWPITTLKPELIRESARFIARHRPASLVHPGRHTTWYGDDTQRSRAIAILNALLGSWGRKGGFFFPAKLSIPEYPYTKYAYHPKPPADAPKGSPYPIADEVIASGVCDATIPGVADYDIKGWLVYGTNLINALPEPEKTKKAIQNLDFIATIDVLPAEIAGWSDVVLPESTYLERCDEVNNPGWKVPFLSIRQPAVEPMYDSKPGWWIAREIAHRIGLADYFPWKDSTEYAMERVHAAGYDCEQVRSTGVVVGPKEPTTEEEGLELSFPTPSGKIELFSKALKDAGADPMPNYTAHEEPPAGMYRLLFGRAAVHTFGSTVNNRILSDVFSENAIWVNDRVCDELGLKEGDRVNVINQDEATTGPMLVKRTRRIRPDCVYMVHGWGRNLPQMSRAHGKGGSDSVLVTKVKVDPLMGGTGMNHNFVRLERV